MGHEVEDFDKQVLERSRQVPVVVDFWAEWCGPCRMFAPVIEKAAQEAGGAWELIKVDTDQHPAIAEEQGIQSLPTIRIFKDGKAVAEKLGAMPGGVFKQWIDSTLAALRPPDPRIEQIRESVRQGEFESATQLLEEVLQDQPGNLEAKFMRIQAALAMDPAAVAGLARELEGTAYQERAHYLKELASLVINGGEGDFGEGLAFLRKIRLPEAAAKWIAVLEKDRTHAGARAALKFLFLYLGREHAVTTEFQPRFASLLFS